MIVFRFFRALVRFYLVALCVGLGLALVLAVLGSIAP